MPLSSVPDGSRQTKTIECMQAFEETYAMTQSKISHRPTSLLDEKIFTVETPPNSQNDRVYVSVKAKRDMSPSRLLCFQIVHLPAE